VRWADIAIDETSEAVRVRREMEVACGGEPAAVRRSAAE